MADRSKSLGKKLQQMKLVRHDLSVREKPADEFAIRCGEINHCPEHILCSGNVIDFGLNEIDFFPQHRLSDAMTFEVGKNSKILSRIIAITKEMLINANDLGPGILVLLHFDLKLFKHRLVDQRTRAVKILSHVLETTKFLCGPEDGSPEALGGATAREDAIDALSEGLFTVFAKKSTLADFKQALRASQRLIFDADSDVVIGRVRGLGTLWAMLSCGYLLTLKDLGVAKLIGV